MIENSYYNFTLETHEMIGISMTFLSLFRDYKPNSYLCNYIQPSYI